MDRREFIKTAAVGLPAAAVQPLSHEPGTPAISADSMPSCSETALPSCEQVLLHACRTYPDQWQCHCARMDFAHRFEALLKSVRPDVCVVGDEEYDELVRTGKATASRVMTCRFTWDTYEIKKEVDAPGMLVAIDDASRLHDTPVARAVPFAVLPANYHLRDADNKRRVDRAVASILRDMVSHVANSPDVTAVVNPDIYWKREAYIIDVFGWCHVLHELTPDELARVVPR